MKVISSLMNKSSLNEKRRLGDNNIISRRRVRQCQLFTASSTSSRHHSFASIWMIMMCMMIIMMMMTFDDMMLILIPEDCSITIIQTQSSFVYSLTTIQFPVKSSTTTRIRRNDHHRNLFLNPWSMTTKTELHLHRTSWFEEGIYDQHRKINKASYYKKNRSPSSPIYSSEYSDFNDFDDFDDNKNNEDNKIDRIGGDTNGDDNDISSITILQQLRKRMDDINRDELELVQRIRTGNCTSLVAAVLPDWVRRINVGTYPIAVCGSSSNTIFVINLFTNQVLATNERYSLSEQNLNVDDDDDDDDKENDSVNAHTLRVLYGQYDGGGTISVAINSKNDMIVEGRRSGGVHIWRWNQNDNNKKRKKSASLISESSTTPTSLPDELIYQGSILNLNDCIATSIVFDHKNHYLWIATDKGYCYAYSIPNDDDDDNDDNSQKLPLVLRTQPDYKWKLHSTVVSLSISSSLLSSSKGCAVATTENGYVHLLLCKNNDTDERMLKNDKSYHSLAIHESFILPFDSGSSERRSSNVFASCATIVTIPTPVTAQTENKDNDLSSYIICGCNEGSIYIIPLRMQAKQKIVVEDDDDDDDDDDDSTVNEIDWNRPFQTNVPIRSLMPKHFGPVKCIQSMSRNNKAGSISNENFNNNDNNNSNIIVTAGIDGSIRVWDLSIKKNLYQFLGYKVWIGSVWTDGVRIVTDGADNTIIVHDFSSSIRSIKTK